MKIGIYSRKSKFTGKGESIENQIELCKSYAYKNFENIEDIKVYEDEGFSAKDTDRPQFQIMMKDAKKKKFDKFLCYRLDRASRSVSDFSQMIDTLQEYSIDFISIKESFDTSTPMGKAMMYIASVFAQLERETIAERVRDNMLMLARTGRWLGGKTPLGFKSKPIKYYDDKMNKKKMYMLIPELSEQKIVKLMYQKYLEFDSLTKLEGWVFQNELKTRTGKNYDISTLKKILTNPVYVIADKMIYEYFNKLDSDVASMDKFDGKHGLMVFNKNSVKKHRTDRKDPSEWIVAVGKHKGLISSQDWIQVQNRLDMNSKKAPRVGTGKYGLVAGLIHCGVCGSPMVVRGKTRKSDGFFRHYYKCFLKERSRGLLCSNTNLSGIEVDKLVTEKIKKMGLDDSELMGKLSSNKKNISEIIKSSINSKEQYEEKIKEYEENIKNLTMELAQNKTSTAAKYIIQQIEELDLNVKELKSKINSMEDTTDENLTQQYNIEILRQLIKDFCKNVDNLTFEEKKTFIKKIVKDIVWDGKDLKINIYDGL